MSKPKVSILDGRTIQIGYPSTFCDNVKRSRDVFLQRCFLLEEVISVEVEEHRGVACIHLRRGLTAVADVIMNLSVKLIEPIPSESSAASAAYFELKREGRWVSYARAPRRLSGIGRWVYQGLGYAFLGLSVLGVASPFVPTTPFVLVSSYFFVRSSRRLNRWLLESRLFGPILRDWYLHRGMRRSLRRKLLIVMVAVFTLTVVLAGPASPALPIMLLVSLFSFGFVMQIPAIEDTRSESSDGLKQLAPASPPLRCSAPKCVEMPAW